MARGSRSSNTDSCVSGGNTTSSSMSSTLHAPPVSNGDPIKAECYSPMSNHHHFHKLIEDPNSPWSWSARIQQRFRDMRQHQPGICCKLRHRDEMRDHVPQLAQVRSVVLIPYPCRRRFIFAGRRSEGSGARACGFGRRPWGGER